MDASEQKIAEVLERRPIQQCGGEPKVQLIRVGWQETEDACVSEYDGV